MNATVEPGISSKVSNLSIVKILLNPRYLYEFAHRTGLANANPVRREKADTGYLVHGAMSAVFGESAPKPFYMLNPKEIKSNFNDSGIAVLGYVDSSKFELSDTSSASSGTVNLIEWESSQIKAMPNTFEVGKRLTVTTRLCPVVRTRVFRKSESDKSDELDAFIAACEYQKADTQTPESKRPKLDRFDIYQTWALERLSKHGMDIESLRISSFQITDLSRRDSNRKLKSSQRPSIEVEAVVSVTNTDKFMSAIADGIGRHKAFGFGMLRLSPASR